METGDPVKLFPDFIAGAAVTDQLREVENIAEAVRSRNAQFLFGAGMSRASGVPCAQDLAKALLGRVFPSGKQPNKTEVAQLLNCYPLECIAEAVLGAGRKKRRELQQLLDEHILKPDYPVNKGHEALRDICNMDIKHPLFKRIYTTNFDLLIERAFGYPEGKAVPVIAENWDTLRDLESAGQLPVIHLHGTLANLDFLVTETDIEGDKANALLEGFGNDLGLHTFVFVGYSLRDSDLRRVFYRERKRINVRPELDKKTYVISHFDDSEEHAYLLAKRIWEARGAFLIPADAAAFTMTLCGILANWSCL